MTLGLWRLREVRPEQWWAVDEVNGTAYAVESDLAERLWVADHLLTEPLDVAIRRLSHLSLAIVRAEPFVDLRFLGLTTRYRSQRQSLIDRIRAEFAGAHAVLRQSPDVVVELEPEADVNLLHRSAAGGRTGVSVRPAVGADPVEASGEFPVLPPLDHPHFRSYTGLHAALLETAAGNIVVCGRRRSGKTTTAVISSRHGVARILTDELVLLDALGFACGVALPIRERSESGRASRALPRTADGAGLVEVSHVVVLGSADGEARAQRVPDVSSALQLLAPHVRPLAGPLGVATDNLLTLLRRSQMWHWGLRPWPAMADDIVLALNVTVGADAHCRASGVQHSFG